MTGFYMKHNTWLKWVKENTRNIKLPKVTTQTNKSENVK